MEIELEVTGLPLACGNNAMKRSTSANRRLASASALGALATGFVGANSSDGAAVLQAVDVDIPAEVGEYTVDLDKDGLREFEIQTFSSVNKVADIAAGVGVALDDGSPSHTANLAAGTLVGPGTHVFGTPGADQLNGTVEEPANSGIFVPAGNFQVSDGPGFIGVEFLIDGNTHYGFVGYQGTGEENSANGKVFAVGYENAPNTPILTVTPALSLQADFDADNDVDGADFLIWQRGLGLTGQTNNDNGDADGNGVVDNLDLDVWTNEFGGSAATVAAVGAVPEPGSLPLLAAGAAGVALYRRRRAD
jgi:hypothetical protein